MKTDNIGNEIKKLLLYSIRKSNEYNNKDAIEAVFNMLRNILLRDLNADRFSEFKSNIFLLHFFLKETDNNRELNKRIIERSFLLFHEILMGVFYLRAKTKNEFKDAYKSITDSYTLFLKKQISENNVKDFKIFYDIVASTPYLFPEINFQFKSYKGSIIFKLSYSYIITIAVQSWLWHLYRNNSIDRSNLIRFQIFIDPKPVDYRILLNILSTTNTDEMLNWTLWDNLQTERSLEDWIIFGITIYFLVSNIYKFKINEDEEFILKLYSESLIINCKELLENSSKWNAAFTEIEANNKFNLNDIEKEQQKSFFERSLLFSLYKIDFKDKCQKFISFLEQIQA